MLQYNFMIAFNGSVVKWHDEMVKCIEEINFLSIPKISEWFFTQQR